MPWLWLAFKLVYFDTQSIRQLTSRERPGTENIRQNARIVRHRESFEFNDMKYGDFSSIAQLGVGLHIGTAIFQLYGEFGAEPLVRTLARIKRLLPDDEHREGVKELQADYDLLVSDYDIFKIQFFKEYRKYIVINSVVAAALIVVLIVLAYKSDDPITEAWQAITVPMIALSVLPALITFISLVFDASKRVASLKQRADILEVKALKSSDRT